MVVPVRLRPEVQKTIMEKIKLKLAKWLLNSSQYQFVAIKEKDGNIWVDGDVKAMRYMDIEGYLWNRKK